jgi:hypothetical protein
MKRIIRMVITVALITGLLVGCSSIKAKETFRGLESQEGGFSALFPDKPKREVQTLNTVEGEIDVILYSANMDDSTYVVIYAEYPKDAIKNSDPDKMLDGARDEGVANSKGKLLKETPIVLGNNKGRELKIENDNGQRIVHQRIYIVNNRIYQALVEAPAGKKETKDITKFFDSFKVTFK